MTCDRCLKTLDVGEHGLYLCPLEKRSHSTGVNQDEFIGGLTLENLGPEPVTVYSRSELNRELKARKLEPMVRHVEGDKHVRSWVTMDPYTLENGRILAERQAHTKASTTEDDGPMWETLTISDGGAFGVSK